ncbi:6154_t:CDS:10 [Entrophospora sp. SA101]|nr:6154_t:CDS:10 [Entrophospora sp. SA101]
MSTFSRIDYDSAAYNAYRPTYPQKLFEKIYNYHKSHNGSFDAALDVGTGTGQVAQVLADSFKKVYGVDSSAKMLENAVKKSKNITYSVSTAENLGQFGDSSIDLLTVALAAHWFDLPKFLEESYRVLKSPSSSSGGGTLAIWGYSSNTFDNYPTASELFVDYTTNLMRDYWEKGVLEMDNLYRGFDIPERLFKNVKFEVYDGTKESEQYRFMEADWTVSQYEKYLKTFSLKYPNAENPVDKLIARMKEAEGWEDDQLLKIYWHLTVDKKLFTFDVTGDEEIQGKIKLKIEKSDNNNLKNNQNEKEGGNDDKASSLQYKKFKKTKVSDKFIEKRLEKLTKKRNKNKNRFIFEKNNLLSDAIKNAGKYDVWSKEEDDDVNNFKDNDDGDFLQPVKKRKIKEPPTLKLKPTEIIPAVHKPHPEKKKSMLLKEQEEKIAKKNKRKQLEKLNEIIETVEQNTINAEKKLIEKELIRKELSKLPKKKIGKYRVQKLPVEIQLPDELTGSLRKLKPEGNLFQDREKVWTLFSFTTAATGTVPIITSPTKSITNLPIKCSSDTCYGSKAYGWKLH